ncbi:hypothetical protein PFISCL1PPCAC_14917, partial [Pristionchus fissidentatus]
RISPSICSSTIESVGFSVIIRWILSSESFFALRRKFHSRRVDFAVSVVEQLISTGRRRFYIIGVSHVCLIKTGTANDTTISVSS